MQKIIVQVPATPANLGPAFDCLALALDLWNTTTFTFGGSRVRVRVRGEGQGVLPEDETNAIYRGFYHLYSQAEATTPQGLLIECENRIPLSSGLGSSAAALLTGLLAANTWLGKRLEPLELLQVAAEIEGHPDNAAAALFGGLVMVFSEDDKPYVHPIPFAVRQAVVVLPEVELSTQKSRSVLPAQVTLHDATFNCARTALVSEAMRIGNHELLKTAMQDRLHQPYRLPLIPGAQRALQAALDLGAPAVLSGAGPSLVAFPANDLEDVEEAMLQAFRSSGVKARSWIVKTATQPASTDIE